MLCLGTNGYLLADKVNLLHELGVETITVTVNAVTPETILKINPGLWDETGQYCEGVPSAERLLFRQLDGICRAVALHITVKVNAVCVPGVNDGEMDRIAQKVRDCGVQIMNVMPLKPAGRLKHAMPPSPAEIHALRARLGTILPQMYHCVQCRADAVDSCQRAAKKPMAVLSKLSSLNRTNGKNYTNVFTRGGCYAII